MLKSNLLVTKEWIMPLIVGDKYFLIFSVNVLLRTFGNSILIECSCNVFDTHGRGEGGGRRWEEGAW